MGNELTSTHYSELLSFILFSLVTGHHGNLKIRIWAAAGRWESLNFAGAGRHFAVEREGLRDAVRVGVE